MKKTVSTSENQSLYQKIQLQNETLRYLPSKFAQTALLKEVLLTPKPGLVDTCNNGSHKDMNINTFFASIIAISPYFDAFYQFGLNNIKVDAAIFLTGIRKIGIQCENSMRLATNNVNTHKGAIFAFGVILSALGRLNRTDFLFSFDEVSIEIALICNNMVARELTDNKTKTAGEKLYQQYQLTGARGEAQSGYAIIKTILPIFFDYLKLNFSEDVAMLFTMLHLFSINKDTNIASRGGIEGLLFVQNYANHLLNSNLLTPNNITQKLNEFNTVLVEKNLSPGGSADLIAVTYFFALLLRDSNITNK